MDLESFFEELFGTNLLVRTSKGIGERSVIDKGETIELVTFHRGIPDLGLHLNGLRVRVKFSSMYADEKKLPPDLPQTWTIDETFRTQPESTN